MSTIKKCDRCGEIYEKNAGVLCIGPNKVIGVRVITNELKSSKNYDLCDNCIIELNNFLENKED